MIVESIWKHHRFDTAQLDPQPAEDVRRFAGFEMPVVNPPEGVAEASSMRTPLMQNESNLVTKARDGRFVRTFRALQTGADGTSEFKLGNIFYRPGMVQPLLEAMRLSDDAIPMLNREEEDSFVAGGADRAGETKAQQDMRKIVILMNGGANSRAKALLYVLRRFRSLDDASPVMQALIGSDPKKPAVGQDIIDYLKRAVVLRDKLAPVSANAILRGRWSGNAAFAAADRAAMPALLSSTLRVPFVLESLEAIGSPTSEAGIAETLTKTDGIYGTAEDHFNGSPIVTMRDFESGRLLFEPLTSRDIRRPIGAMLKEVLGVGRQVPVADVFRDLLTAVVRCKIRENEMLSALGFIAWYALRRPSEAYRTAQEVDKSVPTDAATLLVSSVPYQRLRIDATANVDQQSGIRVRTRPQPAVRAEPTSPTPTAAIAVEAAEVPSNVPTPLPEDAALEPVAVVEAVDAVLPVSAASTSSPEPSASVPAAVDVPQPSVETVEEPGAATTDAVDDMSDFEGVDDEESLATYDVEPASTEETRIDPIEVSDDGIPAAARIVMGSWETRFRLFLDRSAAYGSGESVARASDFEAELRTMLSDVVELGRAFEAATAPVPVDDLLVRIHEVNEQIFQVSGGETEPLEIPASGHVHPDRRPDMEAHVAEGELHARSAIEANRETEEIQSAMPGVPISKRREMAVRVNGLMERIEAETSTAWSAIAAALDHVVPAALPATSDVFPLADAAPAVAAPESPRATPPAATAAVPTPSPKIDVEAPRTRPIPVEKPASASYPDFAAELRREASTNGFAAALGKVSSRPDEDAADMAHDILQAITTPGRVASEKFLDPEVVGIFVSAYLKLHDVRVEWRGTGDLLAVASLEGALFNPGADYTEILDNTDGSGPVAQAAWAVHEAIRNKIASSGIPSPSDFKQARDVLAAREAMTAHRAQALETIEVLRNAQFGYSSATKHRDALDKGYFADMLAAMDDAEKHRDADPFALQNAGHHASDKQAGQLLDSIAREEGISDLEHGGRVKFVKAVVSVSKATIGFLEAAQRSAFEGEGFDELISASDKARAMVGEATSPDPFSGAVLRQADAILARFHDLVTGRAQRPE